MLTLVVADGTCATQPVLRSGAVSAHAKPADAGLAALAVIQKCATDVPSRGGSAWAFGER